MERNGVLIIERHSPPTKLDELPCGTICKVTLYEDKIEFYLQTSVHTGDPVWTLMDP